jgi:predicted 2-oxoglutarate/Fe(II)-dependent dioxygenase YbiX
MKDVVRPSRVYLHPGFLDSVACQRVRAAMDRAAAEPAEILAEDISLDTDARHALSVEVDADTLASVEKAIEAERDALASFFGAPLGEREGPGFLRYGPGGFYRRHRDRGTSASWPGAARRAVAVVVFLNDGFSGGTLRVHGDEQTREVVPLEGTLVAFPAEVLHEVATVVDGTRDTIVDWFY